MSLDRCEAITTALQLQPSSFISIDEPSHLQRKRRRHAFGRADLAETYRKAKDIIIKQKVFRLAQYEEVDDIRRLTICNLWRIERLPDFSLRTFEFRLETGIWEEVTVLKYWPEVPFYPIQSTRSLNWWRSVVERAIWKALVAAGYLDLPRYHTEISDGERDPLGNLLPAQALSVKREMSSNRMAYLLIERYVGKRGGYYGNYEWTPGLLEPKSMEAGARALRAAFYKHFVDRDVLSAMLAIDYRNSTFLRYLRYARMRQALVKVATEHRNLLPLLPSINPDQWGRNDLFSRKLWVKDGRKSTALDRRPIRLMKGQGVEWSSKRVPCQSFEVAAAWRWLSKASSVVVRAWVADNTSSNTIIANLALANVSAKAPVCAYVSVVRNSSYLDRYGVSPNIQLLLRAYLAHCAKLWKEKGHAEVRLWLRSSQASFSVMLDYLRAEGFEQGLPNKRSTWAALVRKSDDWHARVAIENMERELAGLKMLQWASAIPVTEIDGIVFRPLEDSHAMAVEGYQMRHCVGDYTEWAHKGAYRAYSVMEPDGSRSTLGFWIKGRMVRWDQHMSKYNGGISPAAHAAGLRFTEMYQRELEGAKRKKRTSLP